MCVHGNREARLQRTREKIGAPRRAAPQPLALSPLYPLPTPVSRRPLCIPRATPLFLPRLPHGPAGAGRGGSFLDCPALGVPQSWFKTIH